MCGIVGGISKSQNVVPIILSGLSNLEYRGYDSAGIAVVDQKKHMTRKRVVGRVAQLTTECNALTGALGIGHTRWATHGGVTTDNAHPHVSHDMIAVVHNGIIENYSELRDELIKLGYQFVSQTDTEVIAHLIYHMYQQYNHDLIKAVKGAIARLHGAYAIGVMCSDDLEHMLCARLGSPLILGIGDVAAQEMYFASDISALLPVTRRVVYLEEGDIAAIAQDNYQIWDGQDQLVERKVHVSNAQLNDVGLGNYQHYMQKEIFEQPRAIADTLEHLGLNFTPEIFGANAQQIFSNIDKIQIVACGTSLHAGLCAKYWLAQLARLECTVDIASEYRYRDIPVDARTQASTLIISISQSGETADTLACIKYAQELGLHNTLAICNVPESSLVRLSKLHILTCAGSEIGVASTKAFTTQLIVLLYLAITLAKLRGILIANEESELQQAMRTLPGLITSVLNLEPQIKNVAHELYKYHHTLFLARGSLYPIALEGALKLKEISYIHAESYAAGELKHGPLALIDDNMPSIVLMAHGSLYAKTKSNVQEVLARNGKIYLLTDSKDEINERCHKTLHLPTHAVSQYLLPIIYTIPLQLLAYHTAVLKGTDIDKPRNLAKSVTVE